MSTGQLAGKRVVIAGASSGIGAATLALFADQGATVHGLARRVDAMTQALPPEHRDAGRAHAHGVDATDEPAVARCLAEISSCGGIDVLVSAVGSNVSERRLDQLSVADWDAMVRSNLSSAFYLIHGALESLRRSKGTVIVISSASARWTNGSGVAYQAAKLGLLGLTQAASFDEHEREVRFTTILPGLVDTPHLDRRAVPPGEAVRRRSLRPDDVARAALFVAAQPSRVHIPELVLLPTALQAPGCTEIPEAPA